MMRITGIALVLLMALASATIADDDPNVLLSDDFATLDPAWGNANDELYVDQGRLMIKPTGDDWGYTTLYQGGTFDDIDARVKITRLEGGDGGSAGIVFWGADFDNRYEAVLATDGTLSLIRIDRGKALNPVPWKPYDAIKKGANQVNEMRVVTKGRTVTVYVNDKQILTAKGFPPASGSQIGLHGERQDKNSTYVWAFDDFVLRKPQ